MKILLAQNMPADNGGMMAGGAMANGGSTENKGNLMGLGMMMAGPNVAGAPAQYSASDATMMRASGGPTPGLDKIKDGQTLTPRNASDVDILNAALLLEYLESEYYARIVAADQARSYLHGRVQYAAQTLARDEATHVQTVTQMITKLGGTPIAKPQFQFPTNVFLSPIAFLQLSVELEENGVGAYLGAAPMVKNKEVLNFAASIYGNEARHTAWIRFLLGDQIAPRAIEQPRTIAEATAAATPYIVGGAMPAPAPAMAS